MNKKGCGYEGCTAQTVHRPYSGKRDVPSVTTVLEVLNDGKSRSFPWSAAGIAAYTAVHEPEKWQHLGTERCSGTKEGYCPACRKIRSEFDRQWKAKAQLGTHVHHLVDSLSKGLSIEVDDVTEPYITAYELFEKECMPQTIMAERTVLFESEPKWHLEKYNQDWGVYDPDGQLRYLAFSEDHAFELVKRLNGPNRSYRGQFDRIIKLFNPKTFQIEIWMIDYKTGAFYPTEQTLQLNAYIRSQFLTVWENGKEFKDGPLPAVEKGGVLLLHDNGRYDLAELPITSEAWSAFLCLRDEWTFCRQMEVWKKEHPLVLGENEHYIEEKKIA